MNDLVETRIKPLLEKAVNDLDAEIARAEVAVRAWELKWGNVPEQSISDPSIQKRVRQLIRGEEIEGPTDIEKSIAGIRPLWPT